MPTLHEATDLTKKSAVFVIIGIIALTILWFIIKFIGGLLTAPPTPPTGGYGKLPNIAFPKSAVTEKLTYSLQTITGTLPTFPDRMNVHKINEPQPNLLALTNAMNEVNTIGFTTPPQRVTETIYQWDDYTKLPRKIDLNIFTNDIDYISAYATNSAVLAATSLPTKDGDAVSRGQDFISAITPFPAELVASSPHYYTLNGDTLVDAPSITAAQLIRVDFYAPDIDKYKLYYPNYPYSEINATIGSGDSDAQVVEAHFHYRSIDKNSETYAIKTPQQALDELKKGNAYISRYDGTDTTVTISSISLGYYMGLNAEYLLPIIVIEGDENFTAFLPAVTDEATKK